MVIKKVNEGVVVPFPAGAAQRNRNLSGGKKHSWSHITVGPFPDHFKKEKKTGSDMEKVGKAFGRTLKGKPKNEDTLMKAALAVLASRGTFQDDVEVSKKAIAEMKGKGSLEKIRDHHEDQEGKIMRHGERGSFTPPKHKQALADYHSAQKDRAHNLMDKRDAKTWLIKRNTKKNKTKSEEVDQLDELSTNKLIKYGKDSLDHQRSLGDKEKKYGTASKTNRRLMQKRDAGNKLALDKVRRRVDKSTA